VSQIMEWDRAKSGRKMTPVQSSIRNRRGLNNDHHIAVLSDYRAAD
jgi:hypothetical protein